MPYVAPPPAHGTAGTVACPGVGNSRKNADRRKTWTRVWCGGAGPHTCGMQGVG